jgi:DNA-binding MarR family transcriptional regulator
MASMFDQQTKIPLNKALQTIEVFRALDPDMPMGAAVSFLMVALNETDDGGLSVTELSKLGDFALSSASRYAQALGEMDRHHRKGHELVSDTIDPMERRRKILRTTGKGKRVVAQIKAAIGA